MQMSDSAKTGDLLAEISRLEDQIAKLSSQLNSNQETIGLLKLTLAERESRIHELENNLAITPKYLLQNTLAKIEQCKMQIKNGLDEKIINPALAQIRLQIELIQRLVAEAMSFLDRAKRVIDQNLNKTLEVVNQGPDKARLYFEKNIIEPILSLVHQVIETSNRQLKAMKALIGDRIVSPTKSLYDQGIETALALPSQSLIIFQVHLLEPALRSVDKFVDFGHKMTDDSVTELKNRLIRLRKLMDLMLAWIADAVKNSQFWDGKRNIEVMA
jgi:hypothetical protein